jgi:hypothetical protein
VRQNIPEDIVRLIPVLPGDSRYTYFREVLREPARAAQLRLLSVLCPDDSCITDTAGIALKLASSPDKAARKEALVFFGNSARMHLFLMEPFLKKTFENLEFVGNAASLARFY